MKPANDLKALQFRSFTADNCRLGIDDPASRGGDDLKIEDGSWRHWFGRLKRQAAHIHVPERTFDRWERLSIYGVVCRLLPMIPLLPLDETDPDGPLLVRPRDGWPFD